MCGIYGEYFPLKKLSSKKDFITRNDLNFNRGPDMYGYWSNNKNIQLGFRRLSILDLTDKGNQPMLSQNKKLAMVFNGEIYNYKKLKLELISKGYQFNSSGDSEVLINYFECFGIEKTLNIIDGMFAIALFDIEKESLILIRDFAGIKPLFYSFKNGEVVFGSRYDQVAKHTNNVNNKIDNEVLKTYLKLHYIPAPYGILESTFQLEPGKYIVFNVKGEVNEYTYWSFPNITEENLIKDKEEALELLDKALSKSVEEQLVADVPLGTFLSGGIDSPLITKIAKGLKKDIKAFTIGSDSEIHDESSDAKKYSDLIGVDCDIKMMNSSDAKEILNECMNHLQEPFADFSIIPTYELTKNAKENFSVMLSGDGGDELFFGYERFHSVAKNLPYRRIPRALKYLVYGIDKLFFSNQHINECLLTDKLSISHEGLHSRNSNVDIDNVFPTLKKVDKKKIPFYNYSQDKGSLAFYNSMRRAEFYGMMQKTLTKVDRMSMANSLEVRVPFLQKRFIETVVKIHPNLSLANKSKKQILKDFLKRIVPKAPINNNKRGFSIPLSKWIREDLKEEIYSCIFDKDFIFDFNINIVELEKIWNDHQQNIKDYKWIIFTIYSLQKWKKNLKK